MSEKAFRISKDYQTVIGYFQKEGIRPMIDAPEGGVCEYPENQTRALW